MAVINGTSGNNNLLGTTAADTLTGFAGTDSLNGGAGDDTYVYSVVMSGGLITATDGFDVITNGDGTGTGFDKLVFTGLYMDHVNGERVGNDMVIRIYAAAYPAPDAVAIGSVTITDFYLLAANRVDRVEFADGYVTVTPTATGLMFQAHQDDIGNAQAWAYTESSWDENDRTILDKTVYDNGSIDVVASDAANFLVGGAGDDYIVASGGNDTLIGGLGSDYLDGSQGFDTVDYSGAAAAVQASLTNWTATGGAGFDLLYDIEALIGTAFADSLEGNSLDNSFLGGAGNDTINGQLGDDLALYTTAAAAVNVNLTIGTAQDGLGGTDVLSGIEGISGSVFNDTLTGGNSLSGNAVADGLEFFMGNGGNDLINGGAGYDRADYTSATSGVAVTLRGATNGTALDGLGGVDTLVGIEGIRGSSFDDTLTGSAAAFESFEGRAGNDLINGNGGTDRVDYQNSADMVNVNLATGVATDGDGGIDTLLNIENVRGSGLGDVIAGSVLANLLLGWGGNDTLAGGLGDDTLDGGIGFDQVSYADATAAIAVTLNLSNGSVTGGSGTDVLVAIEGAVGSQFSDQLTGDSGTNWFRGNGGNDTIDGGLGFDTASYYEASGAVQVNLSLGTAVGADGSDALIAIEGINGSAFADILAGDANDNFFHGNGGNDTIDGGSGIDTAAYAEASSGVVVSLVTGTSTGPEGNDVLLNIENIGGSRYADTLIGNSGVNGLTGGFGNDTLTGGGGVDTFSFSNSSITGAVVEVDRITDLQAGETLRFSFAADVPFFSGTLIAGDFAAELQSGQVMVGSTAAGVTRLYVGTDNSAGADFMVDLVGTYNINNFDWQGTAQSGTLTFDPAINLPRNLTGTAASDTLTGGNGNDMLSGGASFDQLLGKGGDDVLDGGADGDYLQGDAGNDTLLGGTGFDNLDGGTGNDSLDGGADNDFLVGEDGNDTLTGGVGVDTFYFLALPFGSPTSDVDRVTDLELGETLYFGTPTLTPLILSGDVATGLTQGQVMVGTPTAGVTRLYVGVDMSTGADQVIDLVGNFVASDFGVDSGSGDVLVYDPSFNVPRNLTGTAGFDSLTGANANDTLSGGAGFDQLYGKGGNDLLDGGADSDFLYGDGGNDTLLGGSGDDYLNGGAGDDMLSGGAGLDNFNFYSNPFGSPAGEVDRVTDLELREALEFSFSIPSAGVLSGDDPTGLGQGQLMIGTTLAGVTRLHVGVDSFAGADLTVDLVGNFVASDFQIDASSGYANRLVYDPTFNVPRNLTGTAASDTLDGANAGDTLSGGAGFDQLSGKGGNDFLDGGTDSDFLYGDGGADTLLGGASFDNLYGGTGNDSLNGGTGNDGLNGDAGNDTLVGGDGVDFFSFYSIGFGISPFEVDRIADLEVGESLYFGVPAINPAILSGDVAFGLMQGQLMIGTPSAGVTRLYLGADTIAGADLAVDLVGSFVASDFVVSSTVSLQVIYQPGPRNQTGSAAADSLTGGLFNDSLGGLAGNDTLIGLTGNDTLDGGVGADRMLGGFGDDLYIVDNTLDVIAELNAQGTDTIHSSVTYALGNYIEHLTLTGVAAINATGNGLANILTGNDANNSLNGSAGDDTLIGGLGNDTLNAGSGFDLMQGGQGNDFYVLSNIAQTVTELLGEGTDTVTTNLSYTLGANLENLALTGVTIQNGSGNELANQITGNAAANAINGQDGNDTLLGGTGNDTLNGGNGNDSINGGADNDLLNGGTGNDTMIGGLGDDIFIVDSTGDLVADGVGQGLDEVRSSVSTTLTNNVEKLQLTGTAGLSGTGNGSDNTLLGTSGANALSGLAGNDTISAAAGNDTLRGGAGNDSLTGGPGNDQFVFDTALNAATNVDLITDFTSGADKIGLGSLIFTGINAGTLTTADFFTLGTTAADANDRIVYDQTTGNLFYDADGTGATAAVQFATLGATTHPTVAFADFLMV